MRMAKKNPNIFTIGFKKRNPNHQRVVEILNHTDEKAELIVTAILCYMGEDDKVAAGGADIENFLPMIENLIQTEVQKALQKYDDSANSTVPEREASGESVPDISGEGTPPSINENIMKNITSAMNAFRRT
ncbi:hypothetical protein BRYFOR_09717 [Marvinbryantia formatexigens DSM 14469]|uniref:Uncharacterized protein n=2 Tax=Marvinbryantia TaxID=248744 RepID=C6LM18_9FIRM|nr:hypothetical protein BRYFOR_09717 [Marvinbryantia formatexigens DSM 14469]SDH33253.1 hypothetical protein SAMN05660368_04167 [Marvinbryantia formatexigens]